MTEKYEQFKSHMDNPVNTDGSQCECLKQSYRPMILGGDVQPVHQCPNKATVKIISHAEHEKNVPPMFLCDECLILFKKDTAECLSDYKIIPMKTRRNNR